MTTKTISTYIAGGYTLARRFDTLDIASTGTIFNIAGGPALTIDHSATVNNQGRLGSSPGDGLYATAAIAIVNGSAKYPTAEISGYHGIYARDAATTITNQGFILGIAQYGDGVRLRNGGTVVNGPSGAAAAYIQGRSSGVVAYGATSVTNYGTISGMYGTAIFLTAGGAVINGGLQDRGARISGAVAGVSVATAAASIVNYGTIAASLGAGVDLNGGGGVTNGASGDTMAVLYGHGDGVVAGQSASVVNFGTLVGGVGGGAYSGIYLRGGGMVTNGSAADTGALLEGFQSAVFVAAGAATIDNFGTLRSYSSNAVGWADPNGTAPALLVNGAAKDRAAIISGATTGVYFASGGTVDNFGTITSSKYAAVTWRNPVAKAPAMLVNGSAKDTTARVSGASDGVYFAGDGTVTNFATITANNIAVNGRGTVTLVNGSAADTTATIEGGTIGVFLVAGTVSNFGVIGGVQMRGGVVTNGSATDQTALMEGFYGVQLSIGPNSSVTNFGTMVGTSGTAVSFGEATDTLVVEAGCAFTGQVLGGGGTLDLDSGTGKLSGNLAGGAVTVSGSMASTAFQQFNTLVIGSAASFATTGAVTIAAGQSVIGAGLLTLGAGKTGLTSDGVIEAQGGTVVVNGTVTGSGHALIAAGLLDFTGAITQNVSFLSGVGTLELGKSRTYTGMITGFSASGGTALDLGDIGFTGAGEATYKGSKSGGVLTVTDGKHTAKISLTGDYRTIGFVAASDGHGGTLVRASGSLALAAPAAGSFVAAMAGLGSSHAVTLAGTIGGWPREEAPRLAAPRMQVA